MTEYVKNNMERLKLWQEEYPGDTWAQILSGKGEFYFAVENRGDKQIVCVRCGKSATLKDFEIARYDVSKVRCYQCYLGN
jgi:hypothetical protein